MMLSLFGILSFQQSNVYLVYQLIDVLFVPLPYKRRVCVRATN